LGLHQRVPERTDGVRVLLREGARDHVTVDGQARRRPRARVQDRAHRERPPRLRQERLGEERGVHPAVGERVRHVRERDLDEAELPGGDALDAENGADGQVGDVVERVHAERAACQVGGPLDRGVGERHDREVVRAGPAGLRDDPDVEVLGPGRDGRDVVAEQHIEITGDERGERNGTALDRLRRHGEPAGREQALRGGQRQRRRPDDREHAHAERGGPAVRGLPGAGGEQGRRGEHGHGREKPPPVERPEIVHRVNVGQRSISVQVTDRSRTGHSNLGGYPQVE
jgi:hypothetical protein